MHARACAALAFSLTACAAAEIPPDDEPVDLAAAPAADLAGAGDLTAPADLSPGPIDAAQRPDGGCPPGGTLRPGQSYTVAVDAHRGDEATTEPKADANDGKMGDNPEFQRHNVARAHLDYWFTSKHREAGEPDPRGPQWVDYRPPLGRLGAGRYRITAQYRQTENRASYEALYLIMHRGGNTTLKKDQRQGSGYVDLDLGEFDLGCTGWVRVQDTGSESISFNKMTFRYLGP